MTSPGRRRVWGAAALLGVLLVVWAWTVLDLLASRDAARDAERQLGECVRLVEEIRAGQDRRRQIAVRPLGDAEILECIETARSGAKLAADAVTLVETVPSVRVGSTDFKRQETLVQLQPSDLPRLARFLAGLEKAPAAVRVSHVRLTPARNPRGSGESKESWDLEISLTQTIYDPITARDSPL